MRRPRRVAIVYPGSVPWVARCLDGVRRFARDAGGWHLFSSPPTLRGAEESALDLRSMRGWKGDAIIAVTNDARELRYARKLSVPVVNLAGGLRGPGDIPRVMVNHRKAGRLAADHLLSRGLREVAFFGWQGVWYSDERRAGFCERANEAGVQVATFLRAPDAETNQTWTRRIAGVAKWLRTLPKPIGIFAVHDYRAQFLMEGCQEAGLHIPHNVAVIGMDDDETICEHSAPRLTSVSRNSEQVGWEAAALLDRMMRGAPCPRGDLIIEPDGVAARQSTDMLYAVEPVAQRALDFIRREFRTQFNIEQLAAGAGVSKRTLEMRFRESMNASPHEFLTGLRIRHAQTLLRGMERKTVEEIASESGFGTHPAFYSAFRRVTGETPGSYRRRHAPGTAAGQAP